MREEWIHTTLGDVTALVRRGRAPAYANDGLLVLNQKCIRSGNKIDYSVARRTDVGERPVPEWAIVRDGDVLVNSTGTGTAGRAALVARPPEPMTVDSHITIVRSLPDRVIPEFIGARLSAIAAELEGLASGSTNQIELSRQTLADLPLHLPPLSNQQRIVDLLGSVDSYIDCLQTQVEATRAARSALLADLLSNPGDDWVSMLLGDAFDIRMGRQRSPKNASGSFMVDYLRAANIKDGKLLLDDVKRMNFAPEEQITFRLEPGDVLVTEGSGSRNEVGASARWDSEIAGVVCFQNTLLRMRRVDGVSSSGFAEVIARYFYSSGRWADVASGTNIFHIGAKRAENMLIDLPPLERQGEIVDAVSALDQQLYALERQVASVRAFRSGVLSELLSGERLLDESYDVAVSL